MKTAKLPRAIALALALLTGSTALLHAQSITTSGISGTVTDASGSAVANATVVVTHEPTNTVQREQTGPGGKFHVGGLRAGGPYNVRIDAPDFQPTVLQNITLDLGRDYRTTIVLGAVEAAEPGEEIFELEPLFVDGSAAGRFQTDAYGPGGVIGSQRLAAAPSVTEALADVIRLNPLVVIGDTERLEINAVGQHFRQNSIQVDGVNINDQFGLEASGLPSLNNPISLRTLDQLNVDVAPYDVRNSGFTGASINAVTKSGTNEFSGQIYFYFLNEDLRGENPNTGIEEPYDETTYGISLGGPILKDKLFFFANYEKFERNQVPGDPGFIPDAAAVEQVRQRLINMSTTAYPDGYDPGTWGSLDTSTEEDEKWLVKLDWQINDNHRLTAKYSQTEATEPDFGEYDDARETALTSHFFDVDYKNTAFSTELNSRWTDIFETQVMVARDTFDKTPTYRNQNLIPEMQIRDFPGTNLSGAPSTGSLFFGSEDSRQANDLAVETNKAKAIGVVTLEKQTLTFGIDYEETEFDNLFLQDVYGDIQFRSGGGRTGLENFLDPNFAVGNRISRRTGVEGQEIAAQSDYDVTGYFLQTEWTVLPKLTLLFGVRYDSIGADKTPAANALFNDSFVTQDGRSNLDNTNTIDGTDQIAPRFGFRYQIDDEGRGLLRGGLGLFQGKVPGVYLSNAFSNNGVTTGTIRYANSMTLEDYLNNEFDPENPILYVDTPSGANIDVIDPDFELPSVWRANIAYERKLPWYDTTLTLEYIHSETEKGIYVEDANLNRVGTSPDGRALYDGDPFSGDGFDSRFGTIYNLRNTDKGDAQNIMIQIARPLLDHWYASASYTWGASDDVSSVTSSTAFSNYANRAIFNGNEDVAARSNYEVQHRFLVNAGYEFEWSQRTSTMVSLVYEGRSGRPYSWVFEDDFNNDGIDDNDLFYVPTGADDPLIGFTNGTTAEQIADFFEFIDSTSLAGYKGGNPSRNSERSSFIHRFDVKITQEVKLTDRVVLELFANFINVGNLINDDWGLTSEIPFGFTRAVAAASVEDGKIIYDLGTPQEEQIQSNRSRWSIQLGANLSF